MRQRRLLEKLPLLFLLLVTNPKGCRSCWEAGFYLPNGRDQTAKLASPEIPSTLKKSNVRTSRTPRLIAGHIFRFLLKHVVCRSALGGGVISLAFILAATTFITAGLNHVSGCFFVCTLPPPFRCEPSSNVCSTFSASFNSPFFSFWRSFFFKLASLMHPLCSPPKDFTVNLLHSLFSVALFKL